MKHRNDFRAAAVGVGAGIATVVAAIAWDELDLETAVSTAWERWQMTPAERAELRRLETEMQRRYADVQAGNEQEQHRRERDRAARLAKFRPDMLATTRADGLDALTVPELLDEIAAAQDTLYNARDESWSELPPSQPFIRVWDDQLSALQQQHRELSSGRARRISRLDRLRLSEAIEWVIAHKREYPPIDSAPASVWPVSPVDDAEGA